MIGNRTVFVAELASGDHHLFKWASAIGPIRVAVQITSNGSAHGATALDQGLLLIPQFLHVIRNLSGHRLADHYGGLGADTLYLSPGALLLMILALLFVEPRNHIGCRPICAHPIGVGARAFEQEPDLPQRFDRIHDDPGKVTSPPNAEGAA